MGTENKSNKSLMLVRLIPQVFYWR